VGLRDGASFLAWAIVLVFLLVYVTTRVDAAGLFAYPFTFALVFIANLTPASERADPVLRSLYLPVHLFLAVFGYGRSSRRSRWESSTSSRSGAALALAAAVLLPHPSLERSDTFGWRSVLGGFGFLTLAIVTGFLWNHSLTGATGTGTRRSGRPSWPGSST